MGGETGKEKERDTEREQKRSVLSQKVNVPGAPRGQALPFQSLSYPRELHPMLPSERTHPGEREDTRAAAAQRGHVSPLPRYELGTKLLPCMSGEMKMIFLRAVG